MFTLINAMAATVSVAHSTLLINKHYSTDNTEPKIWAFIKTIMTDIQIKPIIVPIIPKNPIIL